MRKKHLAYVGLGSNVGDRAENIRRAASLLDGEDGVTIIGRSSLYETTPVGYTDQRDFINAVIEVETTLSPQELLTKTKNIEDRLKRRRLIHWGPRTIDLDILIFDDLAIDEPHLHLPHPQIINRAFVLIPLAEIAPDAKHSNGKSIAELLEELDDREGVKLYSDF